MIARKLNLCLVMILGTSAYATGFIGPTMAEFEAGHWDLAFGYASSTEDMNPLALTGLEQTTLSEEGDPCSFSTNFTEFKVTQYSGTVSYGLSDDWQVSLTLGMADLQGTATSGKNGTEPLDFGSNLVYGIGTKFSYHKVEDTIWGISAQLNMLNGSCSGRETGINSNSNSYTETTNYEIDYYDLILAIGPTLDTGGVRAYGGLYYHATVGDYTENRYNIDEVTSYWERTNVSADLEVSSNIGVFLGTQLLFVGGANLKAEVSVSPDSLGFSLGGGITF